MLHDSNNQPTDINTEFTHKIKIHKMLISSLDVNFKRISFVIQIKREIDKMNDNVITNENIFYTHICMSKITIYKAARKCGECRVNHSCFDLIAELYSMAHVCNRKQNRCYLLPIRFHFIFVYVSSIACIFLFMYSHTCRANLPHIKFVLT